MNQLTVNREKCRGCGKCQERCGFKKVITVNGSGQASFKEDRSECLECYHCLMICPHGAISAPGDGTMTVADADGKTSPMLTRHSCRVYADKQLEKEVVNEVIRDANMAPRAYIDFTDRKYIVITGAKLMELRTFLLRKIESHARVFRLLVRLPFLPRALKKNLKNLAWCFSMTVNTNKEREQLFQGAPAVVMVTGSAGNAAGRVNGDLALMQLLIGAEERGLGTCISGYIQGYGQAVGSFLGLPKNDTVLCGAMIGYPAAKFPKYVRRNDTVINWY